MRCLKLSYHIIVLIHVTAQKLCIFSVSCDTIIRLSWISHLFVTMSLDSHTTLNPAMNNMMESTFISWLIKPTIRNGFYLFIYFFNRLHGLIIPSDPKGDCWSQNYAQDLESHQLSRLYFKNLKMHQFNIRYERCFQKKKCQYAFKTGVLVLWVDIHLWPIILKAHSLH